MQTDRHLLTDIRLELTALHNIRPVYAFGVDERVVQGKTVQDMGVVTSSDNLAQAITLRLLTPIGELTALGHPTYGSRLNEVVGMRNTATTRNLAKLFILESLAQEPRIAKVLEVTVTPSPVSRFLVQITLRVAAIPDSAAVTIGPFNLDLRP